MSIVTDLINESLKDEKITDREAARIIHAHNQLQHKSREELKSFLFQYGISVVDYGMKTVDLKRNGRHNFAVKKPVIPKRPVPSIRKAALRKKSNFYRNRNITFVAITGPALIASILGIIL